MKNEFICIQQHNHRSVLWLCCKGFAKRLCGDGKATKHSTRVLCCLALVFQTLHNNAQTNLVPNGSFEQYTTCPSGYAHQAPDFWYQPDKGYGQYWNACSLNNNVPNIGFGSLQYAHTGVAFVGMFYWNGNGHNYFAVKLTDSLKANKNYYIEFYTIPFKVYHKLACNNVGLLVTKKAIYSDTANGKEVIPANPQVVGYGNPIIKDTTQWTKVSAIYKAQGGEQFITLGNFKLANQTNYIINNPNGSYFAAAYFVDDVSVIPLDSMCLKADAGKDTTINNGDSVFIGSYTNGIDSLKWLQNNAVIDSTRPGFWVHPSVTTSYILQQVVNGCFSADTVKVTVGTVPLKFISYALRQAQGDKVENLWTTATEINVSHYNITKSIDGVNFKIIGKVKASNMASNEYSFIDEQAFDGVNYYRIVSVDKDGKTSVSEVRTINIQQSTSNIALFPNPAKDVVNISCKEMKEVRIINCLGQDISRQEPRNDAVIINIKNFNKGLYIVQVMTTKGEVKTEKLVVE